jgi:hypothetical protein
VKLDVSSWKNWRSPILFVKHRLKGLVRHVGVNPMDQQGLRQIETCKVHMDDSLAIKTLVEKHRSGLEFRLAQ